MSELGASPAPPLGPSGGAAAYRLDEFRRLGGFDARLFAYWEGVDLAIRFREATGTEPRSQVSSPPPWLTGARS